MPHSTPRSRRRLDVTERRAAILGAAREAYAEQPYSNVPIARVAQACDSSPSLVFHYFGSKAGLYAAVIDHAITELETAQQNALAGLAPGAPVRERVRIAMAVYLDHIAACPILWGTPLQGGQEPPEALQVRRQAQERAARKLSSLLGVGTFARHLYAIPGFLGLVDQACARWVDQGCPAEDRDPLLEAALGALEGGLGDWKV